MNLCLHREKHEKNNTEWTLNQNMHYTEEIFREKQYTPRKYSFHGMRFGNILQL